MTPDAAFGFERRGTPATLAELGARDGFDVVVVPPFTPRRTGGPQLGDPGRRSWPGTSTAPRGCSDGR